MFLLLSAKRCSVECSPSLKPQNLSPKQPKPLSPKHPLFPKFVWPDAYGREFRGSGAPLA